MFITRKQYEMDLRRAKVDGRREAFNKVNTNCRMDEIEKQFYDSLYRTEKRLYEQIKCIEERLFEKEIVKGEELKCDCECTEMCNN